MKKMYKFTVLAAIICILTFILSGCTSPEEPQTTSVAVVIGNHANSKAMPIQKLSDLIIAACKTYGSVSYTIADGDPRCEELTITAPTKSLSDAKLTATAKKNADIIISQIKSTTAKASELDTLEAVSQASRSFASSNPNAKYLIIMDTGLSTAGSLRFNKSMLASDPSEVVEKLKSISAIPDLTGTQVLWFGCGDVAEPQTPLSYAQVENLKNIWQEILIAGGAESVEMRNDSVGDAIDSSGLPDISLVDIGEDAVIEVPEMITLSEEMVHFIGDTAKYLDKNAAMTALNSVAEQLNKINNKIVIVGTTASGREDFCKNLSQERAETVAKSLIELGVDQSRIERVEGWGFNDPWHVTDRDAQGNFIDEMGAKNRTVRILDASKY